MMYNRLTLLINNPLVHMHWRDTNQMAKRSTNLGIKPKSIHSKKTKKRLAIKREMLAAKAAKGTKNRARKSK
jgi:hypothetical protein